MAGETSVAQLATWWDALDAKTKEVLVAVAREAPDTVKQALGAGDDLDLSGGDLGAALDAAPRSESGYRVPYISVENNEMTTEPYDPKPDEPFALYWADVNQGADIEAYTDLISVTGPESQSYTLDCAALASGGTGPRTIRVGPFPEGHYQIFLTTNSSAPDPDGAIPPAQGYKGGTAIEVQLGAARAATNYTAALSDAVTAVMSLRSVDPYRDAVEADGYLKAALASTQEVLPFFFQEKWDFDVSPLGPKVGELDNAAAVLQSRDAERVMHFYQDNPKPPEDEVGFALTTLGTAAQALINRGFEITNDETVAELAWFVDCLVDVSNKIFL